VITLVISVLLGLLPLAGIVLIALRGMVATVDGLFMGLILLAISAIFLLNAVLEVRRLGLRKPAAQDGKAAAQKAS
jgi:uncharacterized membrane protein